MEYRTSQRIELSRTQLVSFLTLETTLYINFVLIKEK